MVAFRGNSCQHGEKHSHVTSLMLGATKVPGDREGWISIVVTGLRLDCET